MSFKVIYSIVHFREIVLYILNTPGKLLERAQKSPGKPWICQVMKVYHP